jgi:hypothetical protein
MSASPWLAHCITILRYGCSFGNTGNPPFFRDSIPEPTSATARVVFRVAGGCKVRFPWGICRLFGSCPLRSKTLVSPGVFAYWDNCFGFLCLSMPAGAAPGEIIVLCAVLDPKSISVSRLVSRQSRRRPLRGSRPGMVQESGRMLEVLGKLSLHDDTRPLGLG